MWSIMLRLPSLTLLQAFMVLVAVAFAHRDESPTYGLCKKQNIDCMHVRYRAADDTKGAGCRAACGKQRGDLNEKMTVYFCEESRKPCKPYEVYGRSGYAKNFERHAMCVSLCHFVAKVEHSSENYVRMCSDTMDPCLEIKRINGTFDAFNKCAFKCDGWPKLENSLENTAIFCPSEGICEDTKYFSNPKAGNAFAGLKTCFINCMSE
ncbi:hypothetical protein SprV_0602230400 [Sparganum proliferum]